MTLCPNSTEGGCRCPEHQPGLLAFAPAELVPAPAPVASLSLVTPGPREICHGYEHGCVCSQCTLRAEHGGEHPPARARVRQPWEPRPARKAA